MSETPPIGAPPSKRLDQRLPTAAPAESGRMPPIQPARCRRSTFPLAVAILTLTSAMRAQTLDDAIAHALAHSPNLRVLEAGVAEARANATLANPFTPSASISTTPG